MKKTLLALLPLMLLTGCQSWGPIWSEVTGARYTKVAIDRSATTLQDVDGVAAIPLQGRERAVRMSPGKRVLTLKADPLRPGEIGDPGVRRLTMDIEPCKRYYVNAQFDSVTSLAWKPVIDYVESIAGCA